ncbi:MAG: carbamoyltransferase C-terminal domain-containing protein [Pirellulales bacterium]
MGLAPYGEPVYRDLILDRLLRLRPDGSFLMNMDYFNYCQGVTMTSAKFHRLFGGPPRDPESAITQRDMDLAASVQAVTEEIMLRMARHVHAQTALPNLVMAGGVALNCVANGRVLREGPFEKLWLQPAAGDAGGALGAAWFTWYQLLENPRVANGHDQQRGSLLGPAFGDDEIAEFLRGQQAPSTRYESDAELCDAVADLIAQEKVVGWFQGRMEFGSRALGSRSILGDARSGRMQSVINQKVKFRESFRPFAPIVLRERVDEYFELRPDQDSPYMLLVAPVQETQRRPENEAEVGRTGIERVNACRSTIPAVTHVDYSARVQTVDSERNPLLHELLRSFERKTGCPVMINTSFNVRGEPIVCTPADAYRCFRMTGIDALVLGRHVLLKNVQAQQASEVERQSYIAAFPLD